MASSFLDQQLDRLEAEVELLHTSLVDGDAAALQAASTRLQRLAIELRPLTDAVRHPQLTRPDRVQRLKNLVLSLAGLRENLLRHSAYVDRALAVIIPSTQKTTYTGNSPLARRAGAFAAYST